MRKTVLAIAAAAGIATLSVGALHAQGGPPAPALDPSAASSGTYKTDASHSMVAFGVNHLGFNDYYGLFGDVDATLNLDKDNLSSSSLEATIPLASVMVPSAGLHDHLLRPGQNGGAPDFFGPNPTAAHFVSTSIQSTGEMTADITGDLTFNGVTKEVTIQAELAGMGTNMMSRKETLGFHGNTTIKRSEWNMGFGVNFGIADDVDLYITVAFEKQ